MGNFSPARDSFSLCQGSLVQSRKRRMRQPCIRITTFNAFFHDLPFFFFLEITQVNSGTVSGIMHTGTALFSTEEKRNLE